MYKCPKCWKTTKEKVDFCQRCRTDITGYDTKIKETSKKQQNDNKSEIERLNDIIDHLRAKGKQAVSSRDKWKMRAETAENKINSTPQNNDKKFKQVKMLFSKMYHPDNIKGDKFEKLVKQEIFKEFWQEIINIEKNNT